MIVSRSTADGMVDPTAISVRVAVPVESAVGEPELPTFAWTKLKLYCDPDAAVIVAAIPLK